MIFFIATFVAIAIISFIMAIRSMSNFEEEPKRRKGYALFWVKNAELLTEGLLEELFQQALKEKVILSFERLFKGNQSALIIYAPITLMQHYPYLNLIEVEDYLQPVVKGSPASSVPNKIHVNTVLGWVMKKKKALDLSLPFHWNNLPLTDDQQLFYQVIAQPLTQRISTTGAKFQLTIRALVSDTAPQKRVEVAKSVSNYLTQSLKLQKEVRYQSTQSLFQSFIKRAYYPIEVKASVVNEKELKYLLGI